MAGFWKVSAPKTLQNLECVKVNALKKQGKCRTFVDACAESTLNCRDLANPGPQSAKTNPRVPSLKPNSSITEQELCKDIPVQQKILTELISITDTEFRGFQMNFDY